jgi:hypothetical protein
LISYNDVIDKLEKYCIKEGLGRVYRGLELSSEFMFDVTQAKTKGTEFCVDPMLPIDLVAVKDVSELETEEKNKHASHQYTLFWYALTKGLNVPRLEERLHFYQFHLSRAVDLRDIRIILVITDKIEPKLENELKELAVTNGFGLWTFKSSLKGPNILCEPCGFRQHMENVIVNPPKDMINLPQVVKDEAGKVGLYLDRFVREAVDSLAGRTPSQAGKRYIDRQVLDLVFNLERVCYSEDLKNLVTTHLQEKDDDFEFVDKAFSALWGKYLPLIKYTQFLKIAEIPLHNIFATMERHYRDHYLHQFQVFVLGSCILDKMITCGCPDLPPNIDKQWLITSSFHDVAYPLQLYDSWAKKFFEESLGIPDMGESDLKSYFIDRSLLSSLGFIINALSERHFGGPLKGNWLSQERGLVLFFYDRITKLKHHCILSSIFLLKQAQKYSPDQVDELFVPPALAIALHHYNDVFKKLNSKDEAWKNLPENRKLESIDFCKNPLAFMLMFCDCVQEWGRPKLGDNPHTEVEGWQTFVLKECMLDKKQCLVKLESPRLNSTDKLYDDKYREIIDLIKMLKAPQGFDFKIILTDKEGQGSNHQFKSI